MFLQWVLYWKVRNFNVVDGNPLCEHFLELPSKSYYPDYYDEIERPMSLFMINKKLKQGEFADLKALVESLLLVFRNARSYNIEESDIYKAAMQLEKLTVSTAESLSPGIKGEVGHKFVLDKMIQHEK
jgi:protein polybromo-1